MTRKKEARNRNLTSQLKQRMTDLNEIGKSRNKAKNEMRENTDFKFGDTVPGIHSIQTMKNYNQVSHEFIKWAKSQGAGNRQDLNEVIQKYGTEYLKHRESQNLSTQTLKRDRAALNKIMTSDKKIDYKFQSTNIHQITRSRSNKNTDNKHFNELNNSALVALAKGTGGRRSDLKKLTPECFYEKNGNLYCRFEQSKGGKDRTVIVRDEYRKEIENRISMTRSNERLFERIHSNADIHSYRRNYAQELYKDIIKNDDLKRDLADLYSARIEPKIKSDYYITKGEDNFFKGKRDDIHLITNALGHNRLEVAVNHYLR